MALHRSHEKQDSDGGKFRKHQDHQDHQDAEEFEDDIVAEEKDPYPAFLGTKENIARMMKSADGFAARAEELMKAQNMAVIQRETLEVVLRSQQRRISGFLSLPISIIFFLAIAASAILHEDVSRVFAVDSALREELADGLDEVEDISQTWDWLQNTLFRKIFTNTDRNGRKISNKDEWNRVLTYNTLTGPILFQQIRGPEKQCEEPYQHLLCYDFSERSTDKFGRFKDNVTARRLLITSCTENSPDNTSYRGGSVTAEERLKFYDSAFDPITEAETSVLHNEERRLVAARSEYSGYLPAPGADANPGAPGNFEVKFFPNTNAELLDEQLNFLKENHWIDRQTQRIRIYALLLNANIGRVRLEQISFDLRFSRGGGVFSGVSMESIFLAMWPGMMSIAAVDGLFFVLLSLKTVSAVKGLRKARRRRQIHALMTTWTMLQWGILGVGWGIVAAIAFLNKKTGELGKDLEAFRETQSNDLPADRNQLGDYFLYNVQWIVFYFSWVRTVLGVYMLVCMFRFFVAFRAQPRLGVVVSALEACVPDAIHLLIVLFPTFLAYSVAGMLIFGRRMQEFSTLQAAIGNSFKMLAEGEYDWAALSEEHFYTAAIWVVSFIILLVLLMMNMFMAIVVEVYLHKRKMSGASDTLWTTIVDSYLRIRNRRRWISTKQLLAGLKDMPAILTRADILKQFTLCDVQLEQLLRAYRYHNEQVYNNSEEMKEWLKMIMVIKVMMDNIHDDLDRLHQGKDEAIAALVAENHSDWLSAISKEMAIQNHFMLSMQWQLHQVQWQWQAIEAVHGSDVTFAPRQGEAEEEPKPVL